MLGHFAASSVRSQGGCAVLGAAFLQEISRQAGHLGPYRHAHSPLTRETLYPELVQTRAHGVYTLEPARF